MRFSVSQIVPAELHDDEAACSGLFDMLTRRAREEAVLLGEPDIRWLEQHVAATRWERLLAWLRIRAPYPPLWLVVMSWPAEPPG